MRESLVSYVGHALPDVYGTQVDGYAIITAAWFSLAFVLCSGSPGVALNNITLKKKGLFSNSKKSTLSVA